MMQKFQYSEDVEYTTQCPTLRGWYTVNIYRYTTIEANENICVIPTIKKSFSLYLEFLKPLWVIYQKKMVIFYRG